MKSRTFLHALAVLILSIPAFAGHAFAAQEAPEKVITCNQGDTKQQVKFYVGDLGNGQDEDKNSVRMKQGHAGLFGHGWNETMGDATKTNSCADCYDASGDFSVSGLLSSGETYTISMTGMKMVGSQYEADLATTVSDGGTSTEHDQCTVTTESYEAN